MSLYQRIGLMQAYGHRISSDLKSFRNAHCLHSLKSAIKHSMKTYDEPNCRE